MQKKKPRTVLFKTSLNFISILLRLCSVAQKAGVFKGKYQHIVIINQLIPFLPALQLFLSHCLPAG